jgi:hypothetical protein
MAGKQSQKQESSEHSRNEGRRNFLKQFSLLTALAVSPPAFVKAAYIEAGYAEFYGFLLFFHLRN